MHCVICIVSRWPSLADWAGFPPPQLLQIFCVDVPLNNQPVLVVTVGSDMCGRKRVNVIANQVTIHLDHLTVRSLNLVFTLRHNGALIIINDYINYKDFLIVWCCILYMYCFSFTIFDLMSYFKFCSSKMCLMYNSNKKYNLIYSSE